MLYIIYEQEASNYNISISFHHEQIKVSLHTLTKINKW